MKFSKTENNARSDRFCFKKLSGGGSTTSGSGCSSTARSTISIHSKRSNKWWLSVNSSEKISIKQANRIVYEELLLTL